MLTINENVCGDPAGRVLCLYFGFARLSPSLWSMVPDGAGGVLVFAPGCGDGWEARSIAALGGRGSQHLSSIWGLLGAEQPCSLWNSWLPIGAVHGARLCEWWGSHRQRSPGLPGLAGERASLQSFSSTGTTLPVAKLPPPRGVPPRFNCPEQPPPLPGDPLPWSGRHGGTWHWGGTWCHGGTWRHWVT